MKSAFALALFAALAVFSSNAKPVEPYYKISVKSETEFCSFLPPHPGDFVATTESRGKAFCTKPGLGGEVFPEGFITAAHFLKTDNYAQVTGRFDRKKYDLHASDDGGQYDYHDVPCASCNGYKYFVNLVGPNADTFCIRCCNNSEDCNIGISTYGCERVIPGNYDY
ncbi:uncharacterized protein BX663DRAFT_469160 [Cokeromyces recurvatus]|uniref:uncharacterized protein n=1 Tax=Cokeromyces recurvatus TaxID=90255 RepID=UPI0022210655|nr:uncharacterized protein BX663DRAFT_469160 [Cokeromyces recurvatus]KAI7905275.1 hypothetical protein BX663DRAFT_469160 [Cokeromyces recurvatus]